MIRTKISPAAQATLWDIRTGSRISNGEFDPAAALIEATVDGISCTEEVLRTTNEASERSGIPLNRLFEALIPNGVAALPKPSRLEETFMHTASSAPGELRIDGIIFERRGRRIFAIFDVSPAFSAIFIIPQKKHIAPPVFNKKLTASLPPLRTADETASAPPVKKEYNVPATMKTADIITIIMSPAIDFNSMLCYNKNYTKTIIQKSLLQLYFLISCLMKNFLQNNHAL